VQPAIADVEGLAGVEEEHPVKWDCPLAGHDPQAEEGGHQPCRRHGLEELP
jgi:hypothetical protein